MSKGYKYDLLIFQTEARQARSDVRSMMDKMDPNFWPTRGRRSSASSSEETPPPFWAHRGRAIDELESVLTERAGSEEVAPPFWAHRGREIPCPEHGSLSLPLSAEEPRWVMFNRRDADEIGPGTEDAFWISHGPHGFDGLSPNEFWVSRGKKERSQKKDVLRGLAMQQDDFYPTRGKRDLPKPTYVS